MVDGRPYGDPQQVAAGDGTAPVDRKWTVTLPPGKHRLAVKAETADSYALSQPLEITRSGAEPVTGNLYVLAVGVDPQATAGVESADAAAAHAVASSLDSAGKSRFGQVTVRSLSDSQATPAAIDAELAEMNRRMTAADTGVVYYGARCRPQGINCV